MKKPNLNLGIGGTVGRLFRRRTRDTAEEDVNSLKEMSSSDRRRLSSFADEKLPVLDVENLVRLAVVRDNGIEKSALDSRTYKSFVLDNGLQVLLISDPKLEKSAAALSVRVGNHSDPPEIPGLAHFLEHMLFLGTEKYPDEAEYSTFLNDHGGANNAFTSAEETNYHFDVMSDFFCEALDRFSQFFISPLFKAETASRELEAVDNEFSRSLQTDAQRMWHVFKAVSNQPHPFNRFGMGNSSTLRDIPDEAGINVREALFEFHNKYYSANQMKLVLVGRDDLEMMEAYCQEFFQPIPNTDAPNPYPYPNPVGPAFEKLNLGKRVNIVPVREIRSINMLFPTFPIRYDHFTEESGNDAHWHTHGASSYLSHLLCREDPGSILSYLREKQWANSMTASTTSSFSDFSVFSITIGCTDIGITRHVDDIVQVVYDYMSLVHDFGPMKWYFDEISALAAIKFRFKSEEHPFSCATSRASKMHEYPIDKILSASWIETEFSAECIQRMIDVVKPENCLLLVMHKSLEDSANHEEQWYKAKYSVSDVEEEQLIAWSRRSENSHIQSLSLPTQNEFIPENFNTFDFDKPEPLFTVPYASIAEEMQEVIESHPNSIRTLAFSQVTPSLIDLSHSHIDDKRSVARAEIERSLHETWEGKDDTWRPPVLVKVKKHSLLWFKQDITFNRPETTVRLLLKTHAFSNSPLQHVKSLLYVNMVDDCLSESNYPAAVSGLNYTRGVDSNGLGITVLGYTDKIDKYFEFIMKSFRKTEHFKEAQFGRIKENLIKSLTNERKNGPLSHSQKSLYHLMQSSAWTPAEKLEHLQNVTLQEVINQESVLFEDLHLEMFVYGNYRVEKSFNLLDIAESVFGCNELQQIPEPSRAVNLELRKQYVYVEHSHDHENPNSAVILAFQIDTITPKLQCLSSIMEQFTHEKFFHQLRTLEALGYICYASQFSVHGVVFFKFCLQSNSKNPVYLNERIESFIESLKDDVDALEEDQFEDMINSFINSTLQETRSMQSEEGHWYSSIESGLYDFSFRIDTATAAANLSIEDFKEFYRNYFSWNAPMRRKILVGMLCKSHAEECFGSDYQTMMETKHVEGKGLGDAIDHLFHADTVHQGEVVHLSDKKVMGEIVEYYPPARELLQG